MTRARRLVSPENTAFYRLRLGAAALTLLAVIGAALALNGAYGGGPEVIAHRVSLHPQNSLIAEAQVTLSAAARVFIEYENPAAGKFVTALSEPGTEHHIPVVRLRPETAYAYTIGIQPGGGPAAYGPAGEFTTGPLPPELAGVQIRAAGRSTQPLLATDYKDLTNAWYFLWDETGNIVWYYALQDLENLEVARRNHSIRQKPGGNLVFISYLCCIIEITPLGEAVNWIDLNTRQGLPHHDFRLLPDGRILYPGRTRVAEAGPPRRGRGAAASSVIDRLHIWNPSDGSIETVWDARDFWDISDPAQWPDPELNFSWTHLNSLSPGAGGNLIVSARNRNQIIALSPDFQRIEWQLGGPDSDYEFPHPGDRFYGQHTAAQLPNGHILLFDNGRGRPAAEGGDYSRALELRLDPASGTAVKVWEYRHDPDLYAPFLSSALRLNNGNTLVNFGVNHAEATTLSPLTLVEVNRPGKALFRLEIHAPGGAGGDFPRLFRAAAGLTSIMGETMLRPPAARFDRRPPPR